MRAKQETDSLMNLVVYLFERLRGEVTIMRHRHSEHRMSISHRVSNLNFFHERSEAEQVVSSLQEILSLPRIEQHSLGNSTPY